MEPTKKKRIVTKIVDVFCAEIEGKFKCFFQYVANDLSQMNSSVIRVFKRRYPMEYKPVVDDIVKDEVAFYAHTILKFGIEFGAWCKIGKSANIGEEALSEVIFGCAQDSKFISVTKVEIVDPLTNWFIWNINGPDINIGKLPKRYHDILEVGSVKSYLDILHRMKYGYYSYTMNEYRLLKRIPLPDVDSFTIIEDEKTGSKTYFHFYGEKAVRQIEVLPDKKIRLSEENPVAEDYSLTSKKFSDYIWQNPNFINEEDFDAIWNQDDNSKESEP